MGRRIEIERSQVVEDSVIVTTNRSLTGTDGEGYSSPDQAGEASTFGARLASDLFESDDALSRVFVSSNVIVIRRRDGWTPAVVDHVSGVIQDFFLYY
jgi:hypothetical protein